MFQVSASDGDSTLYNNKIQYRILYGGGDNFLITDDGAIVTGPFANLDPDQTSPRTSVYK